LPGWRGSQRPQRVIKAIDFENQLQRQNRIVIITLFDQRISDREPLEIAALDDYAELLADLLIEAQDQGELLRKQQREQLLGKGSQESVPRRK
jgi:hypothetical protein